MHATRVCDFILAERIASYYDFFFQVYIHTIVLYFIFQIFYTSLFRLFFY